MTVRECSSGTIDRRRIDGELEIAWLVPADVGVVNSARRRPWWGWTRDEIPDLAMDVYGIWTFMFVDLLVDRLRVPLSDTDKDGGSEVVVEVLG